MFRQFRELFCNLILTKRDYDRRWIKDAFHTVSQLSYDELIQEKPKTTNLSPTFPFVFGYDPDLDLPSTMKTAAVQVRAQLPHHPIAKSLPQKVVTKPARNPWPAPPSAWLF